MRRYLPTLAVLGLLLASAPLRAEEGRVCKVLPQFVDHKGRASLSPSLYERDAYQFYLRRHPQFCTGLRVMAQWKASGVDWQKLKLRAELRGLLTNSIQTITLEQPVKKGGLAGNWAEFNITGDQYKNFGELVAWRVTLFEGDKSLGTLESFLWSGVATNSSSP